MKAAVSTSIGCGSSLEDALALVRRTGAETVDLLAIDGWVHVNTSDLAERYDETVARVDGLLAGSGLKPAYVNSGVGPQLHDRSGEACARRRRETAGLVRFMNHLGTGLAAVQPRNNDPSRPWEDVLRDCVATLREQAEAGRPAGVEFALELHVNSPFESLDQARRLLEAYPDAALVYDPSHFVMQGIPVRETARLLELARHVHLRDAARGKLQVPYGEGEVDFDWILGSLADRGYTGGCSIEYLQAEDFDATDSARRLLERVNRVDG